MEKKQAILVKYFREGKSFRLISEELEICRKTVTRYVRDYENQHKKGEIKSGFNEGFVLSPRYNISTRYKRKLSSEIKKAINNYLEINSTRLASGQGKQLLKKIDIHECLEEAGFRIGYTTVCNYIREKEDKSREAYVKQEYAAGSVCEFDWGEVKINLAGEQHTLQLAVFTSAHSNYRFAKLFHRQDTLAFQQSHADFFCFTQGVYHQMVYDNMRVAVARFIGRNEKEATKGLKNLSVWYNFSFRFCNASKGNEKGHVERSVEYIRRKTFGRKDCFDDLESANNYLASRCRELNNKTPHGSAQSIKAQFEKEKPLLREVPGVFPCYETELGKVDKYATISYKTNRYSIPENLVGKQVELRISVDQIKVFYQTKEVCRHPRNYTHHQWYLEIHHYLKTMSKKPGSIENSVAFHQMDKFYTHLYANHFQENARDFILLLSYIKEEGITMDELAEYVKEIQIKSLEVSSDKTKVLYRNSLSKVNGNELNTIGQFSEASETHENCKKQLEEVTELQLMYRFNTGNRPEKTANQ